MQLFAYLAVLLFYVGVGCLGLLLCLGFAISPTHRFMAKRVAGAIVGSYPGVFLFQALALPPVVIAIFLFLGLNHITGELSGVSQVVVASLALLSTFGLFAAASITGFLVGWGVGYRIASGLSFRAALQASRVLSYLVRVADRVVKKNAV